MGRSSAGRQRLPSLPLFPSLLSFSLLYLIISINYSRTSFFSFIFWPRYFSLPPLDSSMLLCLQLHSLILPLRRHISLVITSSLLNLPASPLIFSSTFHLPSFILPSIFPHLSSSSFLSNFLSPCNLSISVPPSRGSY